MDSAVSTIVQAYLDSIASDPASENVGLPSWTTEVAGKKFGLDSKNIYIAGLKIPAAVLALLPISAGNIDQNRAYSHLMDLRADLLYAAQRAQTLEEFKQVIREIRLRKEREREFERNQRTAPPPETTGHAVSGVKLVDTDETVVLVTGASLDRRGAGPASGLPAQVGDRSPRGEDTRTAAPWSWPISGTCRTGSSS